MPLVLNPPGYPSAWASLRAEGPFQDAAKQIQSDLPALSSGDTRKVEGCQERTAKLLLWVPNSPMSQTWCGDAISIVHCASLSRSNSTRAKGSITFAFSTSSLDVCRCGTWFLSDARGLSSGLTFIQNYCSGRPETFASFSPPLKEACRD